MPTKYDAAVAELYQAPLERFVAERKRLAGELEASGDKAGAARLAKTTRPPVSAWAVNQLWWQERKAFGELFSTAERLRDVDADADATAAHRDAISALRSRATKILRDAGKAASEATLRRITSTLTALAATGNFDPEPPGALSGDRDPPGFDVQGLTGFGSGRRATGKAAEPNGKRKHADVAATKGHDRASEIAERRRLERERAERKAERERLERKLRIAQSALEARREELSRLKEKIGETTDAVAEAKRVVRELERELEKQS
ncbi:MAG TPA: hypothetical protein VFZ53_19145 [Polyangiaceae bacterium]